MMCRDDLRHGLRLLRLLRKWHCEATICADCGGLEVAPAGPLLEVVRHAFEAPQAVLVALSAASNQQLAWKNQPAGDHDQPYCFGQEQNRTNLGTFAGHAFAALEQFRAFVQDAGGATFAAGED